jgi:isopropylmalate/homocitrate/citramalate synthase
MAWGMDSFAFLGTLVTIFGTIVALAVWMVKKSTARDATSAAREAAVSDRFIEHLERTQREAVEERAADRIERATEREEFLSGLRAISHSVEELTATMRDDLVPRIKAVEDKVGV